MRVVFRADASIQIGTGHVMRCLTLADELESLGSQIIFVCRNLHGFMPEMITNKKYELVLLPSPEKDLNERLEGPKHANWLGVRWELDALQVCGRIKSADWIVVDHYALDHEWEKNLRQVVKKIFVIDDLADRKHDCDLILDHNLYEDYSSRYSDLVPNFCKCLIGPKFALLRKEFLEKSQKSCPKKNKINNIFVCFGGCDAQNETGKVLKAFASFEHIGFSIDVVVGKSNPHAKMIRELCSRMKFARYHYGPSNMAELMGKSDLAIGSGGVVSWERCALSLPSLVISIADNQVEIAKSLQKIGAIQYLGKSKDVSYQNIKNSIQRLLLDSKSLKSMRIAAGKVTDGYGVKRVASVIEGGDENIGIVYR